MQMSEPEVQRCHLWCDLPLASASPCFLSSIEATAFFPQMGSGAPRGTNGEDRSLPRARLNSGTIDTLENTDIECWGRKPPAARRQAFATN